MAAADIDGGQSREATHVFLAAPYTQWMDWDAGRVKPTPRTFLSSVREAMMERDWAVFSAHENEEWGKSWLPADVCTPADFEAVRRADIVCAVLGEPPSPGVLIELGWASAFGKPVVLVAEEGLSLPHLVSGLPSIAWCQTLLVPAFYTSDHGFPAPGLLSKLLDACDAGVSAARLNAAAVYEAAVQVSCGYRRRSS